MLQLPVELRRQCFDLLNSDVESLKALRLVSKELGTLARETLFRTAILHHTDESADRLALLIRSNLNSLVRRVIINTSNNPELMGEGCQNESEVLDSFREGIAGTSKFENLKEVHLKFARECAVEDPELLIGDEPAETVAFRTTILELVVKVIIKATKVEGLTIKNLQDYHNREFFESEDFVDVRAKLSELHLQITTEIDWAAEEHTFSKPACHSGFGNDLPELWLRPTTEQLTRLTLYSLDCPWGVAPFVDLRAIPPFAHLKSLCLGHFTIAHDWQINWILAHGPTLQQLRLDNCPIIFAMNLEHEEATKNFPDLRPTVGDAPDIPDYSKQYFKTIDLRWHHVFDRFRTGAPQLRDFVLGFGDWDENRAFEERYDLTSRLLPRRYYVFDCTSAGKWDYNEGHVSSQPRVLYLGPKACEFDFLQCDKDDLAAYLLLLEIIRERSRVQ